MMRAGNVKMTPAARDSPADPTVWTILFSRMLPLPKIRKMATAITATGMDALTVKPTLSPIYALAAAKMIPRIIPVKIALKVNSGRYSCLPIYGLY